MPDEVNTNEDLQALWNEEAAARNTAEESPESLQQIQTTEDHADKVSDAETAADTPTTTAEGKQAEKADPLAGLPQDVVARLAKVDELERQLSQIPALVQSVKTAEGRVAAMQRELDVAKQAAKAVGSAPTTAQIAAARGSLEKWEALKGDFPDWAEATEQFVRAQLAGAPQPAPGVDLGQVQTLVQQQVAEARKELEIGLVDARYEDWRDTVKSPDFVAWFQKQDTQTQALAGSERARDALRMLDMYHKAKEAPAEATNAQRQQKLAAAVTGKPGAAQVRKSVDQMTPAELWEYERKRAAAAGANRGLVY